MRRRRFVNVVLCRRAVVAVVSLCLCVLANASHGQEQPAETASPADRIRALAEQAESSAPTKAESDAAAEIVSTAEPSADAPVSAESEAEQEQAPLPANELLPLGQGQGGLFDGSGGSPSSSGGLGDGWLLSTLAALGVVLVFVFGIRWLLRRGGIVTAAAPQGSVVEVLSRTTIAPRSHVMLMRVGQRILIVSDSSAGMRTLSTIHEPEEVAELLGAIDASKPASMTKNFGGVMKRLSGQWQEEPALVGEDAEVQSLQGDASMDQARGAVSDVRGRLAALAGAGGKS